MKTNQENLITLWKSEETKAFEGWDFSYIEERTTEEALPWNYEKYIHHYLKDSHRLLDMGTGGGEFLLTIRHPYHLTSVTEAWQPNVELCFRKLKPLGITVKQVIDDSNIPYDDNIFDIIINRHEAYDVKEVKRMLKPGGIFITQQVGGKNNIELSEFFDPEFCHENHEFSLTHEVKKFEEAGFEIVVAKESFPYLKFYDVGAFVYFAKIIQWEFPNFSVDNSVDKLMKLHNVIEEKGFIDSKEHRFLILAKLKCETNEG